MIDSDSWKSPTNPNYDIIKCKCLRYERNGGERTCVRRGKVAISQPMESTRQRCARFEEDECVEYERVPLKQSPKRILEIKDRDGSIKKLKKHVIPNCR